MVNKLKTLSLTLVLALFVAAVPSSSFAQDYSNPGQTGGGTNTNTDQGTGVLNTTDDENGLLRWWWVLPLAALPVLFIALNRGDDEERHRQTYRSDGLAGMKGGRTRRDKEEVEEEVEEEERVVL